MSWNQVDWFFPLYSSFSKLFSLFCFVCLYKFYFLNLYLFLAVLDLHFCAAFPLVVVSGGCSLLRFVAFSLEGLLLLQSTGSGSVARARGLDCPMTRRIFLDQELNVSPALVGEGNGTHSSTLAWKIPWTEEPGRLQSVGSLRVRHDWATSLSLFTFMHWRRKWQPTPVFLPGESQGQGSLVGCHPWGHTELDTTEVI